MNFTNLHDAKTNLSKLVEQVQNGEEIIIAKAGTPVAKLCPLGDFTNRKPGKWKGQVFIDKSFDEPLPAEITKAFLGELD